MVKSSKTIDKVIFIVIYVIAFIVVMNKCRFGFVNVDESLYLALPYRILQGDALFLNEWNLSQLMTIPLYPFLKLWFVTGHDLTGIALYWRYLYTVVNAIVGIVLYLLFRKDNERGAMGGALAFMIFAPYNIPALSYNSGAIIALALALALIVKSHNKLCDYLAGILFGIGILCYPYAVLLYFYIVAVILVLKPERKWDRIIFFTLGNATMLVVLLAAIFSRCSLSELLNVIPIMVGGETEGHNGGFKYKLLSYFPVVFAGSSYITFMVIAFALCILGALILKKVPRKYFSCAVLVITFVCIILSLVYDNYINHLMVAINLCALYFFIAYRNSRDMFWYIWVPGFILSIVMHIQSNNGYYSIATAGVVTLMCSSVVIFKSIQEEKVEAPLKLLEILCVVVFIAQIAGELYIRTTGVFWEGELTVKDQTELITDGPDKGIYVTPEKKELYYSYYNDVKKYVSDDERVLFLSDKSWLYLFGSYENAGYSPWTYGVVDVAVGMLEHYYEVNPDKEPTLIFIDGQFKEYQPRMEAKGYHVQTETENGNLILIQ